MSLRSLKIDSDYRTAGSSAALSFYKRCLSTCVQYDRAAGYFSSAVFIFVRDQVVDFAKRGGRARLICSPNLSKEDVEAIRIGTESPELIASKCLDAELTALLADERATSHIRVLSTLVSFGILEIRIGIRTSGNGLYHEKLGIFSDLSGDSVSFIGSSNETWMGWHDDGNYEAIEVFCSWTQDSARVTKHQSHFDRLWNGKDINLKVFSIPDALKQRICVFAEPSIDALALPPAPPSTKSHPTNRPQKRRHQLEAISSWEENGYRGVLKHATGSGKTLTALFAMSDHLDRGGAVLVLVPSQLLLSQWEEEIKSFYADPALLIAGGGNTSWRDSGLLRIFTNSSSTSGGRIVLATMQTARSKDFISRVSGGDHLMIVADEVHQIGSAENSSVLVVNAGKRLGLSATPERYGDAVGTANIFDYFGPIIPPEYSLQDAIADGHLVRYRYEPIPVYLTENEVADWLALTKEISLLSARAHASLAGDKSLNDRIQLLLIKRARIAKKAENKTTVATSILKTNYKPDQRWLVYCEDQHQVQTVVSATRSWCSEVMEYHSNMTGDRQATLQWFQDHGGILVAIACLDEGVNIPSISHALILASSQNPRQFIQRRGRILRRHPSKHFAEIYDALVVTDSTASSTVSDSLIQAELRRAVEFAKSAVNQSARLTLREIAIRSGIDPDTVDTSDEGSHDQEDDTHA